MTVVKIEELAIPRLESYLIFFTIVYPLLEESLWLYQFWVPLPPTACSIPQVPKVIAMILKNYKDVLSGVVQTI